MYANEIGGDGPHNYVLMCLVALQDPGLTVFPTHRLVNHLTPEQHETLANTHPRRLRGRPAGRQHAARAPRERRPRDRLHRLALQAAVHADAEGPADRRRRAQCPRGAVPSARHGRARGADPQGRSEDDRREHRPPRWARVRARLRAGAAADQRPHVRRGILHGAHPSGEDPGGRRRRREHAARSRPTSTRRSPLASCSTLSTNKTNEGHRPPTARRRLRAHGRDRRPRADGRRADRPGRRRRRPEPRRSCSPRRSRAAPRSRSRCTPSARAGIWPTSRSRRSTSKAERGAPTKFTLTIRLPDGLSDEQIERLSVIAAKCPVHRTLDGDVDLRGADRDGRRRRRLSRRPTPRRSAARRPRARRHRSFTSTGRVADRWTTTSNPARRASSAVALTQ